MRKLILEEWLSLDGFASDEKGETDFFPSTEANKMSDQEQLKFLDDIDLIIMGRKTYTIFSGYWPEVSVDKELLADKLNSIPKIVFSKTLKAAPWGKWPAVEIVQADAATEIKKIKDQQGKNIVIWGSISLAQSLIKQNLFDEYRLHVCPTAIGTGRALFPDERMRTTLKLADVTKYDTDVVLMKYKS